MANVSAARPELAHSVAGRLVDARPDLLLSFGTSGGVDPKLSPGDIVVGSSVVLDDGSSLTCDPEWSERISKKLNIQCSNVFGSYDKLGPISKADVFSRFQAVTVDLESHILGQAAVSANIPFAVIRAVAEPADFKVPAWTMDAIRFDGSESLMPIIAGICLHPWQIGSLSSLSQYKRTALSSLTDALRILGPEITPYQSREE